jgi:hypothetical protein
LQVPRLTVLEGPLGGLAPTPTGAAIVDVPHPDARARGKFARPGPFTVGSLVWTADAPQRPGGHGGPIFGLREHVGWLAGDADRVDPSDVVKQVSFLHASRTVDAGEFREHYRHHVEVARRHMPALWQYVQYDVTDIDATHADADRSGAADGIVAVSVLWFRSTDDFLHRYFASPEDEAEFRSQEGFLDLSKAFTFVGTSHPSAGPADRP